MYGLGTVINVVAILVGASIGVLLGHRPPERTRVTVTDALGHHTGHRWPERRRPADQALVDAVGRGSPLLIVIGATASAASPGHRCRSSDDWQRWAVAAAQTLRRGTFPGARTVSWRLCRPPLVSASDRWRWRLPSATDPARHRRTDAQSDARRIRLDRLRRVSGLG